MEEVTTSELTVYDTVEHDLNTVEHDPNTVVHDLNTVDHDLISDLTAEPCVLYVAAADPPSIVTSNTETSVVPQVTTAAPNVTTGVPNVTTAVPTLTSHSVQSSCTAEETVPSSSPLLLKTSVPAVFDGIMSVYESNKQHSMTLLFQQRW